ncbi:MAG: hypothetical protein DMF68_03215 [Acidobacteria bacterium]|nr:MAG: hypothetical protein DMF68_03215 [Acidobacteriota bacterium]
MDLGVSQEGDGAWTRSKTRGAEASRGGSVRDAAFRLTSAVVGRRFKGAFDEMRRAQGFSAAELQERAEARLALLLQHAAENVPFYRDAYRNLGLDPNQLHGLDDLRKLPVINKNILREYRSEDFLAANVPVNRRLQATTSGSTGEPFSFYLDRRMMPLVFASHLFYDSWFGLHPFDRHIRIVAPSMMQRPVQGDTLKAARLRYAATTRLQSLYESWTQRSASVFEADAVEVHRQTEAFRPHYIVGYTSTLAVIASELLKRNLPLARKLKGIITIAEILTPERKLLIERYFDAPVINRYGQREFKFWCSQNCMDAPERFHVNTELVISEILREDGTPAAEGEVGRLVLTNLHNYVMPFIRYDTGDLARAEGQTVCACGRGFPLIERVEGRAAECIKDSSGKLVSPMSLSLYLFASNDFADTVRHYQLVEESQNRLRLLVVPADGFNEQARERLCDSLAQLLGESVTIEVKTVKAIPLEKSGKRPLIKPFHHVGVA